MKWWDQMHDLSFQFRLYRISRSSPSGLRERKEISGMANMIDLGWPKACGFLWSLVSYPFEWFLLDQENFLESWNLWLERSLTALIADVHLHQAVGKSCLHPSDDRKLTTSQDHAFIWMAHHAGRLPSFYWAGIFFLVSSSYWSWYFPLDWWQI